MRAQTSLVLMVCTVLTVLSALTGCGRDDPGVISEGTPAPVAEATLREHGFRSIPVGVKPADAGASYWLAPDAAFIVLTYRRVDAVQEVSRIERGIPGIGYLGKQRWDDHGLVGVNRLDARAFGAARP